jgi:hypothetical protein
MIGKEILLVFKYFNFFSRSFSKFKMRFYFVIWFHRPSVTFTDLRFEPSARNL